MPTHAQQRTAANHLQVWSALRWMQYMQTIIRAWHKVVLSSIQIQGGDKRRVSLPTTVARKYCPVVVWVVVFRVMLYAELRFTAKTFGLPSSYTHVFDVHHSRQCIFSREESL